MNSLNRTPILPQQTTQGSQAPQQPIITGSNNKGNSKIPSNSEQPMSQFWKDDWDWNKNWETPLLDTYRDVEATPEPFPLEVLPVDIKGAIEEVEKITKAPIPLIFASCMSVISATVQGLVNATYPTLNGNKSVPCSLFFLTLADSGERKTSVDSHFKKPLIDWEKEKVKEYGTAMKSFKGAKKAWDTRTKILENQMQKSPNPNSSQITSDFTTHYQNEPEKPIKKKLIIMDATTEAFMKELQSYPVKAQLSSEGGTILGSNAMGVENIMKTLGQYNELWDGNGIQRDRIAEEANVSVGEVRVTLGVAVQPSVFDQFMVNTKRLGKDSGFLARFLLSRPISTKGTRFIDISRQKIETPYLKNYNERISQLLNLDIRFNNDDKIFQCIDILMSREAETLWEDFYNRIEEQQDEGGNYDHISGFASKSSEHLVRLATCLHIFCDKTGQNSLIEKDIIESAIEIMYWYIREQKRFDNKSTESELLSDLKYLLEKIKDHCDENEYIIEDSKFRANTRYKVGGNLQQYRRLLSTLENLKCIRLFKRGKGKKQYIALNPKLVN